jgi:hypothetical protein
MMMVIRKFSKEGEKREARRNRDREMYKERNTDRRMRREGTGK